MKEKLSVGWREWVCLPDLNIDSIKVKVDTGARTSSLHACFIEPFEQDGLQMVRFGVQPRQKDVKTIVVCECPIADYRQVTDSGGHREMRYVIKTFIMLGEKRWRIEVTLANRSKMSFRMLLGRNALKGVTVFPDRSYVHGRLDLSKKVAN